MKAEELRIGNLANENDIGVIEIKSIEDGFCWVSKVKNNAHFHLDVNQINPIPLTEEWLLKFGFEKKGEAFRHEYWYINDFHIQIHGDRFPLRIWGGESAPHLTQYIGHKTKHVHQLQNLYFALTGEELTIKD